MTESTEELAGWMLSADGSHKDDAVSDFEKVGLIHETVHRRVTKSSNGRGFLFRLTFRCFALLCIPIFMMAINPPLKGHRRFLEPFTSIAVVNDMPVTKTAARSNPDLIYPRVFVVPIPREFNRDLLNCTRSDVEDVEVRLPFHVKQEDAARFWKTGIEKPFGGTSTGATEQGTNFSYTKLHPHSFGGEYDADVYFHTMIEGYIRRVENPEHADLFYVPAYFKQRMPCHPKASTYKGLEATEKRLSKRIFSWMERFPQKPGMVGPNFFTVVGDVCSCSEYPDESNWHCNPMRHHPDLSERMRIVSFETTAYQPSQTTNVVMPYMSQMHDLNWKPNAIRKMLVLAVIGQREGCVGCGPCAVEQSRHLSATECMPGCLSIRNPLIDQVRKHKGPDVFLWTREDGPNQAWAFHNEIWAPPGGQVLKLMMSSTFCLQPAGDTLSRKSFFESIIAGCIPVVFRNDDAFLAQFPFSRTIPYRKLWYYVPEKCVINGECDSEGNTNSTGSIVELLRQVPPHEISSRQGFMKKYGRRLLFSRHNSTKGGYNDLDNPDAFLSILAETWHLV